MQQLNKFVPPVSNTIALLLLAFYVLVSIGVINAFIINGFHVLGG